MSPARGRGSAGIGREEPQAYGAARSFHATPESLRKQLTALALRTSTERDVELLLQPSLFPLKAIKPHRFKIPSPK